MSNVGLTLRQVRFTNKAFWRNPASAFFTFAFPLMFLVIFTALLGNGEVQLEGSTVRQSSYYVAAMAAFSVISACYTNIAMSVTFQRENGVLKRLRGTPLPGWTYLTGRILHSAFVALILVTICATFGAALYHATIPTGESLLQFLVTLVVGAASFAALGLAITAIVPNADAAPAIVNASILPLLFLSGIFIPIGVDAPGWIVFIGRVFPIRPFVAAMSAGFLGTPFAWSDLLVVAAWGLVGLALAIRFFSWEPRR